jgi:hypothetical protein
MATATRTGAMTITDMDTMIMGMRMHMQQWDIDSAIGLSSPA